MTQNQRLDKWLWMARFYKNRATAVDAIKGGHVHVNGERSKPARAVRVGDTVTITKGMYRWCIEIMALAERRGPAKEAQALYQESNASKEQRAQLQQERKLVSPAPTKRPDKRQRAKIIRFINKKDI